MSSTADCKHRAGVTHSGCVWCELDALSAKLDRALEHLRALAHGAVTLEDERIGYVEMQVEREDLSDALAFIAEMEMVDSGVVQCGNNAPNTGANQDNVNSPQHYTSHPSGIECIQVTEWMNFNIGNAVKYLWRADLKGKALEDIEKARWYIAREIQRRKGATSAGQVAPAHIYYANKETAK